MIQLAATTKGLLAFSSISLEFARRLLPTFILMDEESWRSCDVTQVLREATMRRRRFKQSLVVLYVATTLCAIRESCHAEFVFLGPSPYLSAADSPFPLSGNPSFYLEDFEDDPGCVPGPGTICGGGKFDARGVRMVYGNTGSGSSVDADDGMIDGSGAEGASATSETVFANPDITFYFDAIEFDFDEDELGFYPTIVGFVLTAGAGERSGLTVFDADGNAANFDTTSIFLDSLTTSDDRFIGVMNPIGISRLQMGRTIIVASGDFTSPQIDHLQYGIPEPTAIGLLLSAFGASSVCRFHRGVRL